MLQLGSRPRKRTRQSSSSRRRTPRLPPSRGTHGPHRRARRGARPRGGRGDSHCLGRQPAPLPAHARAPVHAGRRPGSGSPRRAQPGRTHRPARPRPRLAAPTSSSFSSSPKPSPRRRWKRLAAWPRTSPAPTRRSRSCSAAHPASRLPRAVRRPVLHRPLPSTQPASSTRPRPPAASCSACVLLLLLLAGAGAIYWQNDPTAPGPVRPTLGPRADLAPKAAAAAAAPRPPRRPAPPPAPAPAPTEDVAALRREFEAFLAQRAPAVAALSEREKDALFAEFLARHRQTATP